MATISGISGLSMGMSFFQNIAIAAVIGATASKDAFDVAAYVPQTMLFMFGLDLFRGISITLFSRLDVNKSEDPSRVFSTFLNVIILVSLFVIVAAEIFVEPLIEMFGPGLAPESKVLAIRLAYFLIPTLGLIAIISLAGSILLANHYYGMTEALRMFPKITALIGVLCWGKTFDVWVLVFAMIAGLLAELPVMFYFLRRCGLRYHFILEANSVTIKSAFIDAIPIGIGTIIVCLSEIIMRRTVSYGEVGTIACFTYSFMFSGILITLIGRPASSSLMPRVSRSLEAGDYQTSSNLLGKSLGLIVLVCLVCSVIVRVEAPVIVSIVLGRGRFGPDEIEQTSRFLSILFLGVLGMGIRMLAIGVLLARRKAKTIMVYCFISSAVRAGLSAWGYRWWGVTAAAIGFVGGAWVDGLLCIGSAVWVVKLHRRMLDPKGICRWIIACLIVLILPLIPNLFGMVEYTESLFTKLIHLSIVGVVAGLAFLVAAWVIRLYTVRRILDIFRNIIHKFRKNTVKITSVPHEGDK